MRDSNQYDRFLLSDVAQAKHERPSPVQVSREPLFDRPDEAQTDEKYDDDPVPPRHNPLATPSAVHAYQSLAAADDLVQPEASRENQHRHSTIDSSQRLARTTHVRSRYPSSAPCKVSR